MNRITSFGAFWLFILAILGSSFATMPQGTTASNKALQPFIVTRLVGPDSGEGSEVDIGIGEKKVISIVLEAIKRYNISPNELAISELRYRITICKGAAWIHRDEQCPKPGQKAIGLERSPGSAKVEDHDCFSPVVEAKMPVKRMLFITSLDKEGKETHLKKEAALDAFVKIMVDASSDVTVTSIPSTVPEVFQLVIHVGDKRIADLRAQSRNLASAEQCVSVWSLGAVFECDIPSCDVLLLPHMQLHELKEYVPMGQYRFHALLPSPPLYVVTEWPATVP